MVKIAPSIASGPVIHLADTIRILENAGADIIHFDIEDGTFVPAMTIGTKVIKEMRPLTNLPFDVHLMTREPEWLIPILAEMGANMVSVHYEACPYPRRTLGIIHESGMQAGLAFNPKTPIPTLKHYLPFLSFVLILTTEPETTYCAYLPSVLKKVEGGKKQQGIAKVLWEVDGGFTAENISDAVAVGADIVVSGRGVFMDGAIENNIAEMKKVTNKLWDT